MLAQNFKTAEDLDVTDIELESLIGVLGMLERGELVYADCDPWLRPCQSNEFNMGIPLKTNSCGTIGCIAGWACHISGGKAFPEFINDVDWTRKNKELKKLFGIGESTRDLSPITPSQAATALRSYLTTGKSRWYLALA